MHEPFIYFNLLLFCELLEQDSFDKICAPVTRAVKELQFLVNLMFSIFLTRTYSLLLGERMKDFLRQNASDKQQQEKLNFLCVGDSFKISQHLLYFSVFCWDLTQSPPRDDRRRVRWCEWITTGEPGPKAQVARRDQDTTTLIYRDRKVSLIYYSTWRFWHLEATTFNWTMAKSRQEPSQRRARWKWTLQFSEI